MLEDILNPKPIREGDIVIIKNPAKPRPFWKLSRVIKLFRGSDNRVCSALIKRGDCITDNHSLKYLHPFEFFLTQRYFPDNPAEEEEENISSPSENLPTKAPDKITNNRPKRIKKSRSNPAYIYY